MKTRLTYIIRLYAVILAMFAVQKPLFMWLDKAEDPSYSAADTLAVVAHGLLLDIPVTGYLIVLPLLITVVSVWTGRPLPLRRLASFYYLPVAVLSALAFVADTSLYPFWKFKLDATIFYYIDSPKDAFASVSVWYLLVRLVLIAACTAVIFFCLRKATPRMMPPMTGATAARRCAATLSFILLMIPLGISIRGGLGESTANIGKVYFSEDEYLNHSAVNPMFSMLYSLGKAENYADEFEYFDEPRRASLFRGLYPQTPADTASLLNTRRPDVLLILMESFGGQIVEAVGGRADIAPNYNRLAAEGVIFTRCYSNSFRTDRGMVSALSGYPAFPTLSVMKLPIKSRTLPCMANTLNAEGYRSTFLYGGDINFTNMQSYLRTGGYGTIISDSDFPADKKKDNPWGADDGVTFDSLFSIIGAQKHHPWHIGFLTLSSHEPFEVPYNRLKEQIPNAFAYTDECLGRFVERMRKTPLWDNLLIICIPDHGFQYPANITHEQHHRNTMLWIGGAVKAHKTVSTVMNQSDMAATLLAQLGIGHEDYTFSRDVLSPAYRYPFAFFTFKEGFGFADSTGHTVYDIIGNRISEYRPATTSGDKTAADRRAELGKAVMQSIYDDLGNR